MPAFTSFSFTSCSATLADGTRVGPAGAIEVLIVNNQQQCHSVLSSSTLSVYNS